MDVHRPMAPAYLLEMKLMEDISQRFKINSCKVAFSTNNS